MVLRQSGGHGGNVCSAALQGRFAEGLASCINSRLAPHERERLDFEASAMPPLAPPAQQQAGSPHSLLILSESL